MRVLKCDLKRWIFLDFDARMKMNIERPSFTHLSQLKLWEGDHESKQAVEELSRPRY
jgi:hypothetical protein